MHIDSVKKTFLPLLVEFAQRAEAEGLPTLSPSHFIDAAKALCLINLDSRQDISLVLEALWASTSYEREILQQVFAVFFSNAAQDRFLYEKGNIFTILLSHGFSREQVGALKEWLESRFISRSLLDWTETAHAHSAWISKLASFRDGYDQSSAGVLAHRISNSLGWSELERVLYQAQQVLEGQYGADGAKLVRAFEKEIFARKADLRRFVEQSVGRVSADATLSVSELEFPVQKLVEQLRNQIRASIRHKSKGRLDIKSTLRKATETFGVPIRIVRSDQRTKYPLWIFVCDVSDSVRSTVSLLLGAVKMLHQELTRSKVFLFTNQIVDISSDLKKARSVESFLHRFRNQLSGNSNYGVIMHQLNEYSKQWGPNTVLVFLGDARTNGHASSSDMLASMHRRVDRIWWLNPEPIALWNRGDSVINQYKPYCDQLLPFYNMDTFRYAIQMMANCFK